MLCFQGIPSWINTRPVCFHLSQIINKRFVFSSPRLSINGLLSPLTCYFLGKVPPCQTRFYLINSSSLSASFNLCSVLISPADPSPALGRAASPGMALPQQYPGHLEFPAQGQPALLAPPGITWLLQLTLGSHLLSPRTQHCSAGKEGMP